MNSAGGSETLSRLALAAEPPGRWSISKPHSCEICSEEVVQVKTSPVAGVCFECLWKGIDELTPDGKHMICGGCGRLYMGSELITYSSTMSRDLEEAKLAANSGCEIYKWLLARLAQRSNEKVLGNGHFKLSASEFVNKPPRGDENKRCSVEMEYQELESTTTIRLGGVEAWTFKTDEASKYLSSRPVETNVRSLTSVRFAQECFQKCIRTHAKCHMNLTDEYDRLTRTETFVIDQESMTVSDAPSRLLDLGSGKNADQIKVVELSALKKKGTRNPDDSQSFPGFAALSYCWGGNQEFSLTKKSSEKLMQGFSVNELPQTLRDAVWVARNIDIRYLWIDALCIYQDSQQDKLREIASMADYYSKATVTICAASASKVVQGFLSVRDEPRYEFGPVRLSLKNGDRNEGSIYLSQEAENEALPEPTVTRGWTLQESLLSRRMLIYAQKQLNWCCVSSSAECGGIHVHPAGRMLGGDESLVQGIHPMGSLLDRTTRDQWTILVREYTRRSLGFEGDKLLAVSAIATKIMSLCQERSEDKMYVAGMLIEPGDGEMDSWVPRLLWYPFDDIKASTRAEIYRAPSWSWAALDGPIEPLARERFLDDERQLTFAPVESYHIDLQDDLAPFGGVVGGHLQVNARERLLAACLKLPLQFRVITDQNSEKFLKDRAERLEVFPDTYFDEKNIATVCDGDEDLADRVVLIELGWKDWTLSPRGSEVASVGLVAIKSSTPLLETLSRIGIYRLIRGSMEEKYGPEVRLKEAIFPSEELFKGCEVAARTLV